MKRFCYQLIFASFLALLAVPGQAQLSDHALPKLLKVASAPVVHPKRTVKQVLGSIAFSAEEVVDVVHLGLDGLDKSFEALDRNNQYFGALYVVVSKADDLAAKADSGLESAEMYFFGVSN